ncbi:hypothetical protein ACTD5D_33210 [Nocardia takedensis]|uniref:hypothetical protein n=1 Tax=Nocardia takedensis TaxID=259390 RepID=UPI003F761E28
MNDNTTNDPTAEHHTREARWRPRLLATILTPQMSDGWACVGCGHLQGPDRDPAAEPRAFLPIGYGPYGQVFVCEPCDEEHIGLPGVAERAEQTLAAVNDAIRSSGMAVETLAEGMGIAPAELQLALTDTRVLTVTTILLLAEDLGVEAGDWFPRQPRAVFLSSDEITGYLRNLQAEDGTR